MTARYSKVCVLQGEGERVEEAREERLESRWRKRERERERERERDKRVGGERQRV